jgi:hypothetical protein
MTPVIANIVADGEVFSMAIAPLTQGLDMFQRGGARQHMFTTDPARHHTMQLTGHGFVYFFSGMG